MYKLVPYFGEAKEWQGFMLEDGCMYGLDTVDGKCIVTVNEVSYDFITIYKLVDNKGYIWEPIEVDLCDEYFKIGFSKSSDKIRDTIIKYYEYDNNSGWTTLGNEYNALVNAVLDGEYKERFKATELMLRKWVAETSHNLSKELNLKLLYNKRAFRR